MALFHSKYMALYMETALSSGYIHKFASEAQWNQKIYEITPTTVQDNSSN